MFVGTKNKRPFPEWVKWHHIEEHFEEFGSELICADVISDGSKSSRYAFVSFSTKAAAEEAIEWYDGTLFLDRYELHVDHRFGSEGGRGDVSCRPHSSKPGNGHVTRVPTGSGKEVDKMDRRGKERSQNDNSSKPTAASAPQELCYVFVGTKAQKPFPASITRESIEKHFMKFNKHIVSVEREARGHAIVAFSSRVSAQCAINELDGSILEKVQLHVDFYELPKKRRRRRKKNSKLEPLESLPLASKPSTGQRSKEMTTAASAQQQTEVRDSGLSQNASHPTTTFHEIESGTEESDIDEKKCLHAKPIPSSRSTLAKVRPINYTTAVSTRPVSQASSSSDSPGQQNTDLPDMQTAGKVLPNQAMVPLESSQSIVTSVCTLNSEIGEGHELPVMSSAPPPFLSSEDSRIFEGMPFLSTQLQSASASNFAPLSASSVHTPTGGTNSSMPPGWSYSTHTIAPEGAVPYLPSVPLHSQQEHIDHTVSVPGCDTVPFSNLPSQPEVPGLGTDYPLLSESLPLTSPMAALPLFNMPETQPHSGMHSTALLGVPACSETLQPISQSQLQSTVAPAETTVSENPPPLVPIAEVNSMGFQHPTAFQSGHLCPVPAHVPMSSVIKIKGLDPTFSHDSVKMLLQKHRLDGFHYVLSKDRTKANVRLPSPSKASQVAKDMDGEEILGKRLSVSVVGAAAASATAENPNPSDVQCVPIPNRVLQYMVSHCNNELKQFKEEGGIIIQTEGGKVLKASGLVLQQFTDSVAHKVQHSTMDVDHDDMNRLLAVSEDGSSLFAKFSAEIQFKWGVELYPESEQLTVLLIGQPEGVSAASQHLAAALARELRVDPIKLEALVFLVPHLDQDIFKQSGVTVKGFNRGSKKIEFEGPSDALQQAKEEMKVQLKGLSLLEATFRHHRILVISAQKRLQLEMVKAYLHCTEDLGHASSIPIIIIYRDETDRLATLKVIDSDPIERSILPSTESAVLTVRSKMAKLERKHSVAINIQQENKNLIVIHSFVLEDVESVVAKLTQSLEGLFLKDVPLKCLQPEHHAYLRIVLLMRPTEEGKTLLSAILPVTLSYSKFGQIVLQGAAHLMEKAESQILQSSLCQGLLFRQFMFTCQSKFLQQIEECVLRPMKKTKRSKVSYYSETLDKPVANIATDGESPPTFSVSISGKIQHSEDFEEACSLLDALDPRSKSYRIPPYTLPEARKIVAKLDSKGRHNTIVHLNTSNIGSPLIVIRGLHLEDIDATWSDITDCLDSMTKTTQKLEVSFFEAKFIIVKHLSTLYDMRQKCKIDVPHIDRLPELGVALPNLVISIAGVVKDVQQAEAQLRQLLSKCKVHQFSINCPRRNVRMWTKRWEQFCREQEKEHDVLVDFQPQRSPVELRKSSEPPKADGASVFFVVYGTDEDHLKEVERLIKEKENGQESIKQKLDLTDSQIAALCSGLKQNKLDPEWKGCLLMDIASSTGSVTLVAPPSKEFEDVLLQAKEDILKFVRDNEKTTEVFQHNDRLVWVLLLTMHMNRINEVAAKNSVLIRTLAEGSQLEFKGAPVGRKAVIEAALARIKTIEQTVCKHQLMVRPFEVPALSTDEFNQFTVKLEKELCVECIYPKKATAARNKVIREFSKFLGHSVCVQLCEGDLTVDHVDAIVNAANEDLLHIGGLAKAVVDAGGPSIQRESSEHVAKHGKVHAGEAVCLGSGRLPCMKVIHAVAPRWNRGEHNERKTLYNAFYHSLVCAEEEEVKTISFPALGAGVFGIPFDVCAQEAKRAVHSYLSKYPSSQFSVIRFVFFTRQNVYNFARVFGSDEVMEIEREEARAHSPEPTPVHVSTVQKYQWSWADDSGGFSPYPPDISDSLTDTFVSSPRGSYTCIIRGYRYTINFRTMFQTNCSTGYRRKVQRVPISIQKPAVAHSPHVTTTTHSKSLVQWYYQDDQDLFVAYNPGDSACLEQMYTSKSMECGMNIGGRMYEIDFENMQQINIQTGRTRRIRRDDPGKESAACAKSDDNAAAVLVRGLADGIEKAKTQIREKLAGLTKKYRRELPAGATPKFVEKLVEIARACSVHCKVKGVGSAEEVSSQDSDEQGTAKQVIKLKGLQDLVDQATTKIQEEIIELQSRTRVVGSSKVELPPEWEEQSEMFKLFDVGSGTAEWCRIEQRFKATMPAATVVAIKRIQNKLLWERYCQERSRMHQKNAGIVKEKELFHGCCQNSPEDIYSSEEGFDMRYSNAGMWGQANYFAESASYSDNYAHPTSTSLYGRVRFGGIYAARSASYEKEMFLAKVLTGDSYSSPPNGSLRMPPEKYASGAVNLKQVRYDTVNGTTSNTRVYMTYSNDKAYPAYLIRYSTQHSQYY